MFQNTHISKIIEKNLPKLIYKTLYDYKNYFFDWCGIKNINTNLINSKIRDIYDYICNLSEISILHLFENESDELIILFEEFINSFLQILLKLL